MTPRPRGPLLQPGVAILVRPSGSIQLGWDPERAVVLRPPGLDPAVVERFLRTLDGLQTRPQVLWRAGELGLRPEQADALLDAVQHAGLLLLPADGPALVRSVRVHGRGPLTDRVLDWLRAEGVEPARSPGGYRRGEVRGWREDLVILTDTLVVDPRLGAELVLARIAHLPVRIRDGRGVVGPLVLPGATSCLRCADLTRSSGDAEWPHLAAQLLDRVGAASPAMVVRTSALALTELEAIFACSARREPETLDATLEPDPDSHAVHSRRWPAHPDCGCRLVAAGPAA
ncbi:hypothetical protein [Nocardia asteroides]|uniref:hypothetical protein n=1 Tax=Nocardia asteroides TaxID=1824 RepID=UPI001E3770DE|nr:hypothetical protein [Nocardia asteroides]UGT64039.1 hypothetical protein LTT61_12345 [Nocardia asteroides]